MARSLLLSCEAVSKAYGTRALFDDLSFGLAEGDQAGLVGPNGSGKSTLLKILAGIEDPDRGTRSLRSGLRIGYVPQDPVFPARSTVDEVLAAALTGVDEDERPRRMARTRNRPFVTGALRHGPAWLWLIGAMLAAAVLAAAVAANIPAALHVFLGAFTYGVVYTVWLKRRTWWNIVIGGLAGSFAVLAGAALVSPTPGPAALALAAVLFLWTPPHFWSLAIAWRDDYARAGVPMLPVVVGEARAARAILASSGLLVAASLVPFAFGMGLIYLAAAAAGGSYFLLQCWALVRRPGRETARAAFRASLLQLSAVLCGAMLDAVVS